MHTGRAIEETIFSWIEQALQRGNADAAFEQLAERFRRDKQYRSLLDVRLMHARLGLGLPLVSTSRIGDMPKDQQEAYQNAYVRAAREVGELLLADRNIPHAWPYFRAIGETGPIVEALDTFEAPDPDTPEAHEALGATIQIAFQDGLHPRKGFELILRHYGLCRAITMFSGYPERAGRQESLRLLVRSLHDQIFANDGHYADSSHLAPVLKYSAELDDTETLRLAVDIADYGTRLDPMFQFADDPPFENTYTDHGIYLRALAGEDVDVAVRHFEEKAAGSDPQRDGTRPAEVLVTLLVRLSRHGDALAAFRRYLSDVAPDGLSCPSLLQLCQMAGDFEQLKEAAKQQRDPLSYLAALIQEED